MRRIVGVGLLLACFALLSTLEGYAQNPKKDKKTTTVVDSSDLVGDEHVGVLKMVPGSDRLFNAELPMTKYVTVPGKKPTRIQARLLRDTSSGAARNYNKAVNNVARYNNDLVRHQTEMARAKNAGQRNSAQRRINTTMGQLNKAIAQLQRSAVAADAQLAREGIRMAAAMPTLKPIQVKQTVEFQAKEDVKVRTMILPEQFDDKGNRKEYTKEEKEALKGKDKTLPGYESSLERLEVGQKLRVVLEPAKNKSKSSDKSKPNDKDADKDPDKDKDPEKPNDKDKAKANDKDVDKDIDKDKDDSEKKRLVKMIVILEEAPANPKGKGK